MALTVKDILELPSGRHMELVTGSKGLDRPVTSVEIADYEFAPGVGAGAPDASGNAAATDADFEPAGFVITSFLFAKDDPSLILTAVQRLEEMGMAGLGFKQVIYDELPGAVLEFADKRNFPILAFGRDVWFENIIFDIMYAVQFDDKVYLSEEKIDSMLSGHMNRSELDIILKGVSLKFRKYVSAVYITGDVDAGRILRSFYLMKGIHGKGLMLRYGDGLFLITTSAKGDHKSHDLIRAELFELLGIGAADPDSGRAVITGMSDVHEAAELDKAFREAYQCCMASEIEGKTFECFADSGIYRVILPALVNDESEAFAKAVTGTFAENPDLRETAGEYVSVGGDITKTAKALHCHQNTVRYRLGRIRELSGLQGATDSELFMQLKIAIAIDRARNMN